ncbi:uncharacterized protein RSE6_08031 [Rhynchosporium secalis]|uniref:non-specific serine/threonine protein kinase n=1 Tax=Rhynchosporium secalis TaxID=38038 RepID=A0A1E1MEI1_RHYSE|nr:uncharacterized protein RSE6_08031 [Rhynchosporium secalis]
MAPPPKIPEPKLSNPKFPPLSRSIPPLSPVFPPNGGPIAAGAAVAGPVPLVTSSRLGDSWVWDFNNLAAYNKAIKKIDRKVVASTWMNSESRWKNRVGKGWVGKSLLGRGSYGVVGHWSYEGPDREKKGLRDVAVKQSLRNPFPLGGWGLEGEAMALMELGKAKSQHVVKMYRHLYEEMGQRTNSYDVGLVHRIFLEYCPHGDMGEWIKAHLQNNTSVSEAEMWAIFHCLARSCLVMDHGSENANFPTPGWPSQEMVHFDLKLENILIGTPTTDIEHRDASPFKFGDFGMAKRVQNSQSPQYMADHSTWGTPVYYAPEQVLRSNHSAGARPWFDMLGRHTITEPKYGSATNLWQVGLIMHCLMSRSRYPDWETSSINRLRCYNSRLSARLRSSGNTIGTSYDQKCEFNAKMSAYSIELRTLIHECLIVNPKQRPRPSTVVQKSGEAIDLLRMSMGGILNTTFKAYEEPTLSARWYSGQNNGDPATKPRAATQAQVTAADKLHEVRIAMEKAKIAQGIRPVQVSNKSSPREDSPDAPFKTGPIPVQPTQPTQPVQPAQPAQLTPTPATQPNVPNASPGSPSAPGTAIYAPYVNPATPIIVTPAPLAPAPPLQPPAPPIQAPALLPTAKPALIPSLSPIPIPILHKVTQVTSIVTTKSFFGAVIIKNYTLKNLNSDTSILACKRRLADMGCGISSEKQRWMNGRTLMTDYMRLGEFANLVGGRNSVRVTQV